MAIDKIFDGAVDGIADNLFNSVSNSVSEIKAMQQRKAAENVQLVVQALKKIDADIREKYDGVTETIEKRVANIKDGRDGIDGKNGLDGVNGKDGRDGKDGRNGRDGLTGPRGFDGPKGADGKDGRDGEDGVSVTDAHIDFDGSLIISLSSGRVINVGEVVSADIAEKIKVITNGGGTSQPVLDQLASLQAQIDLISSALVYKGTWNASTNTPTLTSSVGTANTFYIVSVAGTTNLNGTSNWGVGDWAVYNGSVWQRIEGGAVGNFTDLSVSGTTTLSGLTASTALALNASKEIVSVTNTGSGNNVLATSPTLVTPVLGTPSSVTLTNATGLPLSTGVTGTLPIANGGTGATTANTAFNALAPSQTGNSGKYLTTNGTSTSWATVASGTVTSVSGTGTVNGLTLTGTVTTSGSLTLGGTLSGISNASLTNSSITINGTATSLGGSISVGTVTSVAATVPSFLSITGSPITSSGTLAISLSGTALPTTSGGTGLTSFTANGVVYASSSSALTTGSALTFDGSKLVNTGYNKSTYQVSTNTVGTFESVGAAYLSYDSSTGASIYSRSNATAENILNLRASTFSFKIGGTQVSSLDSSSFSLYNTPILLSGSTSGYTGFAAPATSNFTIYTLPSSDGTSGQSLVTNGSGTLSWASGTGGTVTSVAASVPSFLSISGSPITSSGTLAITLSGTALPTTSGGTGLTSFTSGGVVYASSTSALTTGSALTFDGTTLGVSNGSAGSAGISITGTYSGSGTVAFLNFQRAGGAVAGTLGYNDASTAIQFGTTTNHSTIFLQNNAEAMRLTSTGLGIGTSSPIVKLQVYDAGNTFSGSFGSVGGSQIVALGNSAGIATIQGFSNSSFSAYSDLALQSGGGNVGIGTSSPSAKLHVSGVGRFARSTDASQYLNLTLETGNATYNAVGSINHVWQNAGTEQMRLDTSGNLGIGTSSPVSPLTVAGTASVNWAGGASSTGTATIGTQGTGGSLLVQTPSVNTSYASGFGVDGTYSVGKSVINLKALGTSSGGPYSADMAFFTSTNTTLSEKMRLDFSGNLGLGVTPSAWTSYKALQVNTGATLASTANQMVLGSNWYYNSGDKYLTTDYSTIYIQNSGQHKWFNAPSGTAGNAITFTQAMTLTASGDLVLGTTGSSSARLYVRGSGTTSSTASFEASNSSGATRLYVQDDGTTRFFGSSGSETARIDSSGNLGIGTTTPSNRLTVSNSSGGNVAAFTNTSSADLNINLTAGVTLLTPSTGTLAFGTSSTERARIDSSGNLLVGTTSAIQASLFSVLAGSSTNCIAAKNTNNNNYLYTGTNSSNTEVFRVAGSGDVLNTNNSYGALSDAKLKENIVDASPKLADLMQVKVRNYNLIGETTKQIGVVAQELETVFPSMVDENADRDEDGNLLETTTKGVKYSVFVPMLIKAMQEQQAIIESLKARLDAANL